jgi:hypothetical protein
MNSCPVKHKGAEKYRKFPKIKKIKNGIMD